MAAVVEMGEVDDIHSKEDNVTDGVVMNGEIADDMELNNSKDISDDEGTVENVVNDLISDEDEASQDNEVMETDNSVDEESKKEEDNVLVSKIKLVNTDEIEETNSAIETEENSIGSEIDNSQEIHNIDDDDDEVNEVNSDDDVQMTDPDINSSASLTNNKNDILDLNEEEEADECMIVDDIKEDPIDVDAEAPTEENGTKTPDKDNEIIELDTPVKKLLGNRKQIELTPRRSTRNLNRSKTYADDSDKEETPSSEESDIEEILPEDPLAVSDPLSSIQDIQIKVNHSTIKVKRNLNSTIVVKDTKRLVEIASKSQPLNNIGTKKEPTLVIIDTNSILSGRGPVPLSHKTNTNTNSNPNSNANSNVNTNPNPNSHPHTATISPAYHHHNVLPVALPAQGVYPANMRATITPIPMNTPKPAPPPPTIVHPPILPSLTDDMFVVEAPSFIVPYVYEKPPVKDLKDFIKDMADEIKKMIEEEEKREEDERKKIAEEKKKAGEEGSDEEEKMETDEDKDKTKDDSAEDQSDKKDAVPDKVEGEAAAKEGDADKKGADVAVTVVKKEGETPVVLPPPATPEVKPLTYFDSPIGKFFVDIGSSLVQEFIQTDLLKQQKRKREREHGQNSLTNKTIISLLKSLEYTKENNQPYKMVAKKCEFCSYKTESALAMAFHCETPHMKNFVYRCNFCEYEVRSPHDILFHMEAEHCVRGRLERAPAFHQCPNCPFEDNQKGKLSRHLVACTRKFKPERNLEPPIDWEPPAKIPRAPRMKQQQSLSNTAAMYQAMAKSSQMQYMKMQANAQSALNRGRGRPTMGMPIKPQQQQVGKSPTMVYKQAVPGGASVLVPTNYQISGNQLYQVLGGTDLGSRIGSHMALVPAMSSTTVMQKSVANKPKPSHQPSISITPLPRGSTSSTAAAAAAAAVTPPATGGQKPGDSNSKNSFVICEICDGYIKDLEQLRNHMQWIHKVKIHPKMIYNRPPLNCQKCQFRFFTDQGLERHLLGSHGLVTSSMQEAANKCKDSGRCPVCGRVYQWKLLNHVARDHNMTLKPAHLSYKCTVCTATFGMYKQFENHVYSAHSVVAKRSIEKKTSNSSPTPKQSSESLLKPLKINDEITIIPQQPKSNGAGSSKEGSPSTSSKNSSNNSTPSTSKIGDTSITRAERLARRKTSLVGDN